MPLKDIYGNTFNFTQKDFEGEYTYNFEDIGETIRRFIQAQQDMFSDYKLPDQVRQAKLKLTNWIDQHHINLEAIKLAKGEATIKFGNSTIINRTTEPLKTKIDIFVFLVDRYIFIDNKQAQSYIQKPPRCKTCGRWNPIKCL